MNNLDKCPASLKKGFSTYSPAALRKLFFGKKVSHILPFPSPQQDINSQAEFLANRQRLSISGYQKKVGLVLEKNQLRLSRPNEASRYILKPIPDDLKNVGEVPANEHLTMQIAEQVFQIQTAPNALIFFPKGEACRQPPKVGACGTTNINIKTIWGI
jgi:serine/threonine-protein kinase HipA